MYASSFAPFAVPSNLIFAFEAVVIGGLGSLWGTLVGGVTLGVAQLIGNQIDPQWGELAGHLVFLGRARLPTDRHVRQGDSSMSDIRVARGTTTSRVFAVVALAAVAVLAFMPSWGEPATQRKMVELFTLLALAQMWNLLAGFAGVVSVGQQAFMGLGAYAMVFLVNVHGEDLYDSVPISALIVAVLAVPMGLVAFRLRGSYFAIGTWVLAEVASKVIITRKSLGAGDGVSLKVSSYSVASSSGCHLLAGDGHRYRSSGTGIPRAAIPARTADAGDS